MCVSSSTSLPSQSSASLYWVISATGSTAVATAIVSSLICSEVFEPSEIVRTIVFEPDESYDHSAVIPVLSTDESLSKSQRYVKLPSFGVELLASNEIVSPALILSLGEKLNTANNSPLEDEPSSSKRQPDKLTNTIMPASNSGPNCNFIACLLCLLFEKPFLPKYALEVK